MPTVSTDVWLLKDHVDFDRDAADDPVMTRFSIPGMLCRGFIRI